MILMTHFRWHLLTALFGPYPRFMANFKKYVLGKGFGGLINRLQSEDLLKKYPKHIMMRFSRTNPSYMVRLRKAISIDSRPLSNFPNIGIQL